MKHILIVLALFVFSSNVFAEGPKADTFKLGAVFGNIALGGDTTDNVSGASKNSIGVGAVLGYSIEDELSFELSYIQSSHDKIDHQDINLGVQYYFNSYEPFYYGLTGGVAFVTNEVAANGTDPSIDDTAFGLFIGAGADVFTKRGLVIGLQARYYKMFGSEIDYKGSKVTLVDDHYSILARVLFQF